MKYAFSQQDFKVKKACDVKDEFTKEPNYDSAFTEHRLMCCCCWEPVQFVDGKKKRPHFKHYPLELDSQEYDCSDCYKRIEKSDNTNLTSEQNSFKGQHREKIQEKIWNSYLTFNVGCSFNKSISYPENNCLQHLRGKVLGILKDKLGKTKLAFSEEIGQDALLHKINNFFEAEGGQKIEAGVKNRLNNASYELSRFWKLTNCEVRRVIEAAKQIDETTQIKRVWLTLRFIIYSKNLLTRIISHALNHFPQKELTKEKESPEKLAEKLSEKILKRIYLINWDFSWKKPRDLKEGFGIDLGEGAEIEMVLIPGGSFLMGSPESEGYKNERSQHPVKVSQFFMSKYLITQEQYKAVMGNNPSKFKGANRPVECVSWDNANTFCKKISDLCSNFYLPEQTFRLPSEAEWEYACRAGTTTPFYFGESITTKCVNYGDSYICGVRAEDVNFRRGTRDVGSLPCNGFWLYDMHGNVYEWCQDVWHENYNGAPTDGIAWESNGDSSRRVVRGGFWGSHPRYCRSAHRNYMYVGNRKYKYKCSTIGFRVVVTENPQSKFYRSKHSRIRYYG